MEVNNDHTQHRKVVAQGHTESIERAGGIAGEGGPTYDEHSEQWKAKVEQHQRLPSGSKGRCIGSQTNLTALMNPESRSLILRQASVSPDFSSFSVVASAVYSNIQIHHITPCCHRMTVATMMQRKLVMQRRRMSCMASIDDYLVGMQSEIPVLLRMSGGSLYAMPGTSSHDVSKRRPFLLKI